MTEPELLREAAERAIGYLEAAAGFPILNEVVLNKDDGTCWCGPTVWQGQAAMRISVSSFATTDDDVERSLEAMLRAASSA